MMADEWANYPVVSEGQPLRITVGGPGAAQGPSWDQFPEVDGGPSAGDYAYDAAQSVGTGAVRGVAALAGMPGDMTSLVAKGGRAAYDYATGSKTPPTAVEKGAQAVGSEAAIALIERLAGRKLPRPQTKLGKYVETATSFIPAAMAGPGSMVRNAVTMGVIPGLMSEGAGDLTEGTPYEPYARGAAALAGGAAGAAFSRPATAARELSGAMEGVTAQQMDAAEQLFQQSQQYGVPITRAEAVQQVTGGATQLGDLQRVVEGQGGMREFFAPRPAQVDAAAREGFDNIVMPPANPSGIGPQVQQAAEGVINDTQRAINTATRPLYQAAEQQRIDPATFQAIQADPVFVEALARVRNDPWIGPTLQGIPDDSVQALDAVRKLLNETGQNLRNPGNADRSNYAAAITETGAGRLTDAADAATGSTPAQIGTYEAARVAQAQMRERYLAPLMNGPLGKLMNTPETKAAADALFPANPLANSAGEVTTAVRALAARNHLAARQLVRAHVESVFNEATQSLTGGANQFGGAKFAAALQGNPQQAANLEAAIRALPHGDSTWSGFSNLLEVLEATGQRQRIGSQTAFNQELQGNLKRGGLASEGVTMAAGAGLQLPQRIRDGIERWRLGKNVDELARVLTDPQAASVFRALANTPPGSVKAPLLAARLYTISTEGARNTRGAQPSSK